MRNLGLLGCPLWLLVLMIGSAFGGPTQEVVSLPLIGWGSNDLAQLGNGRRSLFESPGNVLRANIGLFSNSGSDAGPETFKSIVCASQHCAASTEAGFVYGWGSNYHGQLGQYGNQVSKVVRHARRLRFDSSVTAPLRSIAVTDTSTFVLDATGKLFGAGLLAEVTPTVGRYYSELSPILSVPANIQQIACGPGTCVYTTIQSGTGNICFALMSPTGANFPAISPSPNCTQVLAGGPQTFNLSVSFNHFIASWNDGYIGYGIDDAFQISPYTPVSGQLWFHGTELGMTKAVACGNNTVRLIDGIATTTGSWSHQLENWTHVDIGPNSSSNQLVDITCTSDVLFGLTRDGVIYSWSMAGSSLSLSNFNRSSLPISESILFTKLMEPSSSSNSMFAIGETSSSINEGSWVGFGRNQFGELGLGKTSKAELPTTGSGFSNLFYGENEIVSIVGGDKWSAALTRSSTTGRTRIYVLGNIPTSLWVLGLQVLLDPSTTDTGTSDFKAKHHRYTAFPLPLELDGVEQISSLPSYLVWTSNQQLHMLSMSLPAAVISWPITNTTVLSCGLWDDFGCAVNQTSDFLRLVSPSTPDVPVYSPSPSPFLNMSMGYDFTVVAVAESSGSITLVVTGQNNDKFQLGRNDSASSNNIDVLGDFLIIVSGRYHTLLHNGTDLLSFGSNEQGQVGRQGTALQTCTIDIVPKVSPTTPWTTSIAAIGETSFAVASTGILYAWGANTQSAIMGITTVFSETWQPKIVWNVPTTWHLCNHCAGESMVAHKSGGPRFTSSGPRGNDALISFGRNNHGQLAGHIDDAVGSTLPIFTSLNTQFAPTLPKSSLMGLNDSRYPIGFSAHSGSFIHSASNSHIYYQFSGYDPSDVTIYNTKVPALVMVEVSWVSEGLQTTSVPTIFYHTPGVSGLGSISSGGERLFAVSSDGSSPRVLLDNPGYEPNWNSVTYLGSGGTGIPSFFPSVSNLSPNVFVAAWEDKWYFSGSESFFESKIESVTFSESSQINSILYHNGTLETFNSFGCPSLPQVTQAISANDSRFVMFNDSGLYTCGNSNNFKELGENAQLGIWNLIAYNYHIKQLAALDNTNYMLTTDGKVYAWGLNGPHGLFGMPDCEDDNVIPGTPTCPPDFTGTLTLIQWTVTSPWRLSGVQPYIIKNIFTVPSKLSVHFFAQMRRPEDIEPTTPFAPQAPVTSGAQCPPPRPSPAFTCENGVWTSPSPIVVTPGTEITIGGPSIVQGNVSVEGGGSLVFTLPPIGSGAVLNVNGCITIDGSVIVTLTGDDLKEIDQQSGKSRESILVSAQCGSLSGVTNIAVSAPSDCRKASAQRSGSSDTSLSVVFRVDRSRCDRWWIILVSVLGGVILLVGIISLLVAFTPLKFIVRPFTRRGVKPVMAK